MKEIDLTNKRYGKLVGVKKDLKDGYWTFKCDCGKEKSIYKHNVISGRQVSCGCHKNEKAKERNEGYRKLIDYNKTLYTLWKNIKNRCYSKNNTDYHLYGERGIEIYNEWKDSPLLFILWIENNIGQRPSKKHSLDRIDSNGNYEPNNLRWASPRQQALNRRNNSSSENMNRLMCNLIKEGYTHQRIAEMAGVSKELVIHNTR